METLRWDIFILANSLALLVGNLEYRIRFYQREQQCSRAQQGRK